MKGMKVVLALSGGMDSATLAAYYIDKGAEVCPVSFSYGSKHNEYERESAIKFCAYYGLKLKHVDLPFINNMFKSNLLQSGGPVPEGYYTDKNMALTVVPSRNIIFAAVLSGYAWSINAETIALGIHAGDHAIYEDCREVFVSAMNTAILCGTGNRVRIEAPFQNFTKTDIVTLGLSLTIPVPYNLTRTCYKDQKLSCGKCGSCQERLEAFKLVGQEDPLEYEL